MQATSFSPEISQKPLLRGVLHQFAFFAALVGAGALVLLAHSEPAKIVALLFGVCLAAQLGISALYHRVLWSPRARTWMRRLDHAAIFLLIAGGYTPMFWFYPSHRGDHHALTTIWVGAAIGILKSVLWPNSPRWITALLCVALGWTVVGEVADRASLAGPLVTTLLVASGTTYSLGGLVYALKRPNPRPRVFGYHEVFHSMVVAAAACLYAHAAILLHRT